MAEHDTARTIIFDLVQLEKLGAELERRYRINPTVRVTDVLTHIDAEDHALYFPQLSQLLEDLTKRGNAGAIEDSDGDLNQTEDLGASLHRSLMATALVDAVKLNDSKPLSGKASSSSSGSGSKSESSQMPERIDQFKILRELGAGAFGVVYLAEDESLQRKVAIKVPKVLDPAKCASYINEARKAAAMDCKGIVPIYHVGTKENGVPFVVQKLIDGPTLRFLLSRYGTLPPAHAVTLMRDISIALASAHRLGIYHRDLKPDNILIDGTGVPWIADFGLAISESEQAQRKGEIAGTLMYMSPEQIQGRADWLDGRSDIWALGIMLHELLLGKPPFDGKNRQSLMEQICHREPRPLQQSSPDLADLNEVFIKCCAKSPSDRYASVAELTRDLDILISEGLSTMPIDGSELRFEQPISQYPSDDSHGSRSRGGSGSSGTLLSGRGGTTRVAGGSLTQAGTAVGLSGSLAAGTTSQSGSLTGSVFPTPSVSVTPKAEQWTRFIMIGVGLASIIAIAGQQWISSGPVAVVATGPDVASGSLDLTPPVVEQSSEMKEELETQEPLVALNALSTAEADGTEKLPFIVSSDGTGSHRTIGEAIQSSQTGAYINIKPGKYSEALKITQPIHLTGLEEPEKCIISNANLPPIEITVSLGTVYVSNLTIEGNGIQTNKEFNAVDILSGKLQMNLCHLSTTTQNAVKVHGGSSLEATGCKFFESNAFAVSTKNHIGLSITDCEFFQSGVQSVGGHAVIKDSTFKGSDGIDIAQSNETPNNITNCKFIGCLGRGILVTEMSTASIDGCSFTQCKFGVQVDGSVVRVSTCTFTNCISSALDLHGGKLTVDNKTQIKLCKNFGCTVAGGELELTDVEIADISAAGVISKGPTVIRTKNTTFKKCGSSAVDIVEGMLDVEGGVIEGCEQVGLFLSEKFTRGSVRGTQFIDNPGGAISVGAGTVDCEDISISGSQIGLLLRAAPGTTINMNLTGAKFSDISDIPIDAEGDITLNVMKTDFGDISAGKQFRALGDGPKITLHL